MPLYTGKTTIESLGGNRIEWKAQFRVEQSGEMLVTAPPCEVNVTSWSGPPPGGEPERWNIRVDAPGPLVLEAYDVAFQDSDPPVFRGFVACQWDESTSTMFLRRRNWGGGGSPDLEPGDAVLLTLWFRNTSIPTNYVGPT